MKIRRIILLTLILIGLIVIMPIGFHSGNNKSDNDKGNNNIPPLNPEHLTEEYEFKDTRVIWRIEDIKEDKESIGYTK